MFASDAGFQQVAPGVMATIGRHAGIAIRFSIEAVENEAKTTKEGHPVFEDVEFIEKRVPGDRLNVIHRPVTEDDKREFAAQYASWKTTQQNPIVGTPLKEWPLVTRSQVEAFALNGVRTVEELSGVSDDIASRLGAGVKALRQKAQDWLSVAKGNSTLVQMRSELEKRDARIAALQNQVEELGKLAEIEAKKKKG